MSKIISIAIKNKIATGDNQVIVCNNSDYVVQFTFDSEWDNHDIKTMRVVYGSGGYSETVFTGNTCSLPPVVNCNSVNIGVYAGDIETSTPANYKCIKSILCGDEVHLDPPEDVYNQLVSLVESGAVKGDKGDKGEKGDTPIRGVDYWTEEDKREIVDEVLADIPESGGTITLDTEMSDTSENAVQNKVIKAYVDNAITSAIIDSWEVDL